MSEHENLAESIARSLEQAQRDHAAHLRRFREAVAALPEGTTIRRWRKVTIAGDVFWTKTVRGRERHVVDVLVEVGQPAIEKALKAAGLSFR